MTTEKKTYRPAVRQVLGTPVTLERAAEEIAHEKGQDPDRVKVTTGEDRLRQVARRLAVKAREQEDGRLAAFFCGSKKSIGNKIIYSVVGQWPTDLRDIACREPEGSMGLADSLFPFMGIVPRRDLGVEAYDVNGRFFFVYPDDSLYEYAGRVIEIHRVTDDGQALLDEHAAGSAARDIAASDWASLLNYAFNAPALSEAPRYASAALGLPELEYVYEGPTTLNRVRVQRLPEGDPACARGKEWDARLYVDGQPSPVGRACGDLEEAKEWCRDYFEEVGSSVDLALLPAPDEVARGHVGGLDIAAIREDDAPEVNER